MNKSILTLAFAGMGLLAVANPPKGKHAATDTYKVSTTESTAKWHAKKVTGEHYGIVKIQGGEILANGQNLNSANITIDMTTIESTDMQGEYKGKLDGHLKSDDFFSTEKFNTATLKIKSVSAIKGAKPGENNYNIVADLTIKGITKEITFPAFVVINKGQVIANADFNINRTNYDIRYGSKSFIADIGDKAIDDEFNIKVRIVASK